MKACLEPYNKKSTGRILYKHLIEEGHGKVLEQMECKDRKPHAKNPLMLKDTEF